MDQFIACWKELEYPRTGNAGLHDFHDLLMIAPCTILCGGQGAVDMALDRGRPALAQCLCVPL